MRQKTESTVDILKTEQIRQKEEEKDEDQSAQSVLLL